jgi:acyl dehydratase
MRTFTGQDDLVKAVGETLGPGPWRTVEQSRVDTFADATDDHQWIHVDPVRAAQGPFGGPIAHGYLTLSLLPSLMRELYRADGMRMAVNYGLNRVRFPAPVPVGSRIRAVVEVASAEPVGEGLQLVFRVTVEIEGGAKPACVAESVSRFYF